MSAVYVLAVMAQAKEEIRRYRESLGVTAPSITIPDLAETRAAVAELMDAAESALRREEFKQGPDAGNDGLVRRLRAALARCRGESA